MTGTDGLRLDLTAHHSEYLPADGGVVDVVAAVRAAPGGPAPRHDGLAEVILLDCSGSMGAPQSKMRAARAATLAALEALPDGVAFAVVEGTGTARMVYPQRRRLAVADESSRAAARRAVQRLTPYGGTVIGAWLLLARDLLATRPDAIGHAILLTDGRNEGQRDVDLRAAVQACVGRFTVDCRAVGSADGAHDWDGPELLGIADALGANPVVPVEDLTGLTDEFAAVLDRALAHRAGAARLRVRVGGLARVRFVKQVYPTIVDLTDRGVPAGDLTVDYPIGAWSPTDRRDYQVALEVDPMSPRLRRRIGWLSVHTAADEDPDAVETPVTVEWSEELELVSQVHETVAHYTHQEGYAEQVRLALDAAATGRSGEAERHLGRAVAIAYAGGHDDKLRQLARVAELLDPAAGRVRLRPDADLRRWQYSVAYAPQTSSWASGDPGEADPAGRVAPEPRVEPWEHCGEPRVHPYCDECGAHHRSATGRPG
ncbi:VWA domain-containing protein [Micromonospora sp. WMMD882]|uniref:VWA domain-containing protein n=1 Tax=Micromonospora sp. WMMD882 TaxID=3015151 RepID=UPI00248BD45F|nr:VWA domain-containing protein [Micromonospora sp. WMMD882]WBB80534.1 VWA domain-containing protein [Micromonospora sp. WMMD882]